jgi:hypothetical protein
VKRLILAAAIATLATPAFAQFYQPNYGGGFSMTGPNGTTWVNPTTPTPTYGYGYRR